MIVKLPISQGLVKTVDEIGLPAHGAAMQDCYVDELENVNRRPGLVELCDLSTSASVDGLFWWEEQQIALAVSNGNTYKITDGNGTFSQITHDNTNWATGTRVKFADFSTDIYGANGGKIKQIPSTGNVSDMADGDAPTAVTHVAFLDRYLIANESGTGNFHWSDVNAPTAWSANYAEAEGRRDDLVALISEYLELYLLGKTTLETWNNDGSTPFVRLPQGYVPRGTVAPYSFVWCAVENSFVWMDQNRQVVVLKERTPVPLSLTMTKYIQGFGTVNDAIGDYVEIAGRPYYILSFPTEEKCLAYDFTSAQWYDWGYWNSTNTEYDRFRGNCFCLSPAWNLTLVGDRANGKVYKFDATNYDDDGDTLRTMIRTAHLNHDTEEKRKFNNSLTFRVKRTNVLSEDGTPDLLVRYRDNGSSIWSNEKTVSLQQIGGTEFRGKLTRNGSYYSRQWEFVLSDSYPLCLVSVEENLDFEG